ncbi:MAG: Tol-Pal system beta propeller repeat protein TolB, partial [Mariprofundaceae bacterium]
MFRYLILFICFSFISTAHAVEFDIYQSDFQPLQLAWLVEGDDTHVREKALLRHVVEKDLVSSQSFKSLDPLSFLVDAKAALQHVDYDDWRIIGANVVALCKLTSTGKGWEADFQVHDPFRSKQLIHIKLQRESNELRQLAHQISDYIYKAMIGVRGHFQSQLLYVKKYG